MESEKIITLKTYFANFKSENKNGNFFFPNLERKHFLLFIKKFFGQ